jgi:hypothetical protein
LKKVPKFFSIPSILFMEGGKKSRKKD